ncbi:MAG: aminotransferase class V-fold PLP-dependent enzyme [Marmoricola sp.]
MHQQNAVGTVTSGGTESVLLAVQSARDGVSIGSERPNMVLPATAHAAFHKAAHYFGVEPRIVPVGADFRADPQAMAAASDANTVLFVGSAPSYAHGVIDPITEIAAIAAERGVRCHVDACIGGWVLPWKARLGHVVRPWTFAVDGVTSISVDLHKYGYSAQRRLAACCIAALSCASLRSSPAPTGLATRCSTPPCSRQNPAGL